MAFEFLCVVSLLPLVTVHISVVPYRYAVVNKSSRLSWIRKIRSCVFLGPVLSDAILFRVSLLVVVVIIFSH